MKRMSAIFSALTKLLPLAFRSASGLAIAFTVMFFFAQSQIANASAPPMLVGFWGLAFKGIGTRNYLDQTTAQYSNVVMVGSDCVDGPDCVGGIVEKVQQAALIGQKSLIAVSSILYPWGSLVPRPDYQTRFDDLWRKLGINQLQSNVAGFYIYDEPYWSNGLGTDAKIAWQEVRQGLENVAGYAKRRTGLPNLMLFAYPEVTDSRFTNGFLPQNVDYFGVNCYLAFLEYCSEANIRGMIDIMKAARKTHQKLLFSMDGWYHAPAPQQPPLAYSQIDADINQRTRFWMRLIGDNLQLTGGILPFIYQNVPPPAPDSPPESGMAGLQSLPLSFEAVTIFMQALQNQAWCDGDNLYTSRGRVWQNAPYCLPACENGYCFLPR